MSGALQTVGDGGAARCVICHGEAIGPCARCRRPVCGDCCELVQGGGKPFAVCVSCERGAKRALGGLGGLAVWVLGVVLVVVAMGAALLWLARR